MTISTIALISPGAMGSAVAARLTEGGARVLTSLKGRSAASIERARAAGMIDAGDHELVRSDMVLSIVPPAEAEPLVERLLPLIADAERKPLFIDFNALSPATKRRLAGRLAGVGCTMLDGGIIGPPPRAGSRDTSFPVSGEGAKRAAPLGRLGLDLRVIEGPIGAASALKMGFAGINKGLTGLAAAMLLGAERAGAGAALRRQLAESEADLLRRFQHRIPNMYGKAYRWVAEMREIADFLGPDDPAAEIYEGLARFYERMAADVAGPRSDSGTLDRLLGPEV